MRSPLVMLLLVVVASCGGPARDSQTLHGTALPTPVARPAFVLTDTHGEPYDFATQTKGTVTLLYFGYTHCPDVCPVQMANIAAAMRRLSRADRQRIKVVFVTTDPARDSLPQMRSWLNN
ncbi:MAG: SCO family protein, partial [Gemmatimonadota bacterium]|nr:SCO family protein [Gemmatimonadota bacterium]